MEGIHPMTFARKLWINIRQYKAAYLMAVPVLLYYIIFCYKPMYGVLIAFQDFKPALGMAGSKWVGLKHFVSFFNGAFIKRLLFNTLNLSFTSLVWGFPLPIVLALLLNEMRSVKLKKTVQIITYIPHFISTVVVCGLIQQFCASDGLINNIIAALGGERSPLLANPSLYVPIYVISGLWKQIGWNSIIYIAAISGIDPQLYEAATIDGAGKLRQAWHITLTGILPTIVVLFILRMGSIMSIGHEKTLLLQNSLNMETSDIISTYVYRRGLEEGSFSFSTAVGLFNSLINTLLVIFTNTVSKHLSETSLW